MEKHIVKHKSGISAIIHYFEAQEVEKLIKLIQNSEKGNAKYAATYVKSSEKEGISIDPSGYRTYCKIDTSNAIYAYKNFFSNYTKISIKEIFENLISEFEDYEYLYKILEDDGVEIENIEKFGVRHILPESPKLEARVLSETLDIFTAQLMREIKQIRYYKDSIIVVDKNRISATLKVKRIPALIADSSKIDLLLEESVRNLYYLNQHYESINEKTTILELESIYENYLSDYTFSTIIQKDTTFSDLDMLVIFEVGAESEYIRDLPYDWFFAYKNENRVISPKIVLPKTRIRALRVYASPIYEIAKYLNIRM